MAKQRIKTLGIHDPRTTSRGSITKYRGKKATGTKTGKKLVSMSGTGGARRGRQVLAARRKKRGLG